MIMNQFNNKFDSLKGEMITKEDINSMKNEIGQDINNKFEHMKKIF